MDVASSRSSGGQNFALPEGQEVGIKLAFSHLQNSANEDGAADEWTILWKAVILLSLKILRLSLGGEHEFSVQEGWEVCVSPKWILSCYPIELGSQYLVDGEVLSGDDGHHLVHVLQVRQ